MNGARKSLLLNWYLQPKFEKNLLLLILTMSPAGLRGLDGGLEFGGVEEFEAREAAFVFITSLQGCSNIARNRA
jgi:hypothetical protein